METANAHSPRNLCKRPFLSGLLLAAGVSRRLQPPSTQNFNREKEHGATISCDTKKGYALPPSTTLLKQLLDFQGRPLLQYVIETIVRAELDELVIVLGHEAERIQLAIALPETNRTARLAPTPRNSSQQVHHELHVRATSSVKTSDTFESRSRDPCHTDACLVRFVVNPDFALGQSSSLRAGLRALDPRAQAVAIFLGDQPSIEVSVVHALLAKFFELGEREIASAKTETSNIFAPRIVRPIYVEKPTSPSDAPTHAHSRTPGHPVLFSRAVWEEWEALRTLEGDQGARAIFAARPEWVHEMEIEAQAPFDIDTWEDYERAVDSASSQEIITSND